MGAMVKGARYLTAGPFENAGGFTLASEMCIDPKPGGYAFAGDHPVKTQAEVEPAFASPAEGESP
jgi:hypothetical protein